MSFSIIVMNCETLVSLHSLIRLLVCNYQRSFCLLNRYLNKIYLQKQPSASLPANVVYLGVDYPCHRHCGVRNVTQFSDPHTQMESYRQRARRMVAMATSRYDKALARGLKPPEAWNESTVDWMMAAKVCVCVCMCVCVWHVCT